jgi:hypothetical protein
MNVIAIDRGLNGAGAVSDERGDFITCFDLPTIGKSAARVRDGGASRPRGGCARSRNAAWSATATAGRSRTRGAIWSWDDPSRG